MNLDRIKREAPQHEFKATHYCKKNEVYIHVDNGCFYFLDGDWIQYDDSCRMELIAL